MKPLKIGSCLCLLNKLSADWFWYFVWVVVCGDCLFFTNLLWDVQACDGWECCASLYFYAFTWINTNTFLSLCAFGYKSRFEFSFGLLNIFWNKTGHWRSRWTTLSVIDLNGTLVTCAFCCQTRPSQAQHVGVRPRPIILPVILLFCCFYIVPLVIHLTIVIFPIL